MPMTISTDIDMNASASMIGEKTYGAGKGPNRPLVNFRPDGLLDSAIEELTEKKKPTGKGKKPGWGVTRGEVARRLAACSVFFLHPRFAPVIAEVAEQTDRPFTVAARDVRFALNGQRQRQPDIHPVTVDFAVMEEWLAALERGTLRAAFAVVDKQAGLGRVEIEITDWDEYSARAGG